MIKEDLAWRKVAPVKSWPPDISGESITGIFCGVKQRSGQFGPYSAAHIKDPKGDVFYVSNKYLLQQIEDALIEVGQEIRIVYQGLESPPNERPFRKFDLYVKKDEVVAPSEVRCETVE